MIVISLEAILQYLPDFAENYVETIMLNPEIWLKGSDKSQERVLKKARELAEEYGSKLRADRLVDVIMHCVETVVESDREDRATLVLRLSDLAAVWARQNLTDSVLSKLASYANIYYIRRLHAYPLQAYHVLRVLLDLFSNCKGECRVL